MTACVIMAEGTDVCPAMEITLSGLTADEIEALDEDYSDFTDGYRASVNVIMDETYMEATTDSGAADAYFECSIAFGADLEETETENGFYST